MAAADAPKKTEGTMTTPAPVSPPEARALSVEAPAAKPGPSVLPWVVTGAGVVVAGAGAFLFVNASGDQTAGLDPKFKSQNTYTAVRTRVDADTGLMQVGGTLIGVGVLAAAGGVAWALLGSQPAAPVVVAPTTNGVTVGGAW